MDEDEWEEVQLDQWEEVDLEEEFGPSPEPWYEDFGEGIVTSGLKTAQGLTDLFGGDTTALDAMVQDWEADASQSGWGTGGRVLGEIAQIALPAGAATKGLRMLAGAKAATRTGMLATTGLGDIAGTAVVQGAQKPGEGETRAENAAEGARDAAIGAVLMNPFMKQGFIPKSADAKDLIAKGATLSPGQATANVPVLKGMVDLFEGTSQLVPFLGKSARAARDEGIESVGKVAMKEAAPPGMASKVTETGKAGYRQLQGAFDEAYDNAWKGAKLKKGPATDLMAEVNNYKKYVNPEHEMALNRVNKSILKQLQNKGKINPRNIDRSIAKELKTAYKRPDINGPLISTLEEIKDSFRGSLGKKTINKLAAVDSKHPQRLVIRDAVGKADLKQGVFDMKQLMRSSGKVGGAERKAAGTGPLADIAQQGMDVTEELRLPEVFNWWRKLASEKAPALFPLRATGKIATGQSPLQSDLMQYIISGGKLMGADYED